jgi:hypothetical protein
MVPPLCPLLRTSSDVTTADVTSLTVSNNDTGGATSITGDADGTINITLSGQSNHMTCDMNDGGALLLLRLL